VACERQLEDRSKKSVTVAFARDVDVLRCLCGELNQIGAMGTFGDESAYGNLSVQLAGPHGLLARWAAVPPEDGPPGSGRLVVTGSRGKIALSMPTDGLPWSMTLSGSPTREFTDWNPAAITLQRFIDAIGGASTSPDLIDAAHAVELAETIDRSLVRRRTIDLHFEDHTEENTFKGMMAAGGCLLLMLGLGLVLFVAIFEKANLPGARFWPWLLAAVFGLFSLLQLLLFVFRK
jgi:hypothetical protein